MADKLIFPIGFDLEAAVKDAQSKGDKAIRDLEKIFSRQPLVLKTDTRGFAELLQDTDTLKARLKDVKAQFDKMPTSVKFDLDSEGKVKQLSADGRALWDELMRINTALQGVSMSATQLLRQNQREMEAEQKAEQKRQQAIAASLKAEYKRIEAKKQSEAASRRELEMLNRQYAAEERRQRLAASEASVAKRQKVINTLRAEENTIVNITAKLQHWQKVMNSSAMDGKQFKRATEEVQRLSQKLSEAQARIDRLTGRTKEAATATISASAKQSAAVRQVTNEFKNQDGYVSRLLKRLAVYAGFSAIGSFLTNIREVTAQFELQRVSLGAIIQDQQRANQLFAEIKAFALKSPVSILDLTKYTKQLAAYKIGVDELFETTKKLTDVSVGLGVSMDRVVLAYGQTRATGYLRASEIRQFTEMGVPIVEELAAKLSKMNGELVTAAQVMDMVSKRAISFELVKEVFDDMTSAGGMFYNMQEKQGNTLFGLWAKLGDAASVMYDEIGNTDSVNSAMKTTIQLLTDLMKNWREVGTAMGAAAVGFAAVWSVKKVKGWQSNIDTARIAANERYIASSNAYRAAIKAEQAARATATAEEYRAIAAKTASAEASYNVARAEYLAARNTNLLSKAWGKLKAAFIANWWMVVIAAIGALATAIINAHEKANRLKNALKEIREEGAIESEKSVYNFQTLAKTAVEAADGSNKQKEALEELQRTYRNIIPAQDLTIEKLREMNGEYTSLTNAIRQYIAQQTQQKQIDSIISETESKVIDAQRRMQKFLKKSSIEYNYEDVPLGFSDQQIDKAIKGMRELANTTDDSFKLIRDAFKLYAGVELSDKEVRAIQQFNDSWLSGHVVVTDFVSALREQRTQIDAVVNDMSGATAEMGIFADRWSQTAERIKNTPLTAKENTFLYDRQRTNATIKEYVSALKDDFATIGLAWKDEWANVAEDISTETSRLSIIDFDAITEAVKREGGDYAVTLGNAVRTIQNNYEKLIPTNKTTQALQSKLQQISTQTGVSMDVLRRHLINAGESWEDYSKRVRDAIKDYEAQVEEMQKANAAVASGGAGPLKTYTDEEIKKTGEYAEALKLLLPFLQALTSGGRSTQSDQRLSILQEMVSTLKQVNKEYDELAKKEGATKALADTQRVYADTFKNMQQLAAKYKFELPDFGVPTDTASLTRYLDAIKSAMAKLPKSDKAVLALQVDIEKLNIDDMQKKIEQKLKELSDKISRTKTAKEFYDKILSQTGDVDVAATLTMNVYGNAGEDLFQQTVEQLQTYFSGVEVDLPINFDTQQIDYKALRKIWEADKALPKEMRKIPEAYDSAIKQMLDSADSSNQKMIEGWLKATEKAKTYSDKLADVYRTTATEIERIQKAMASGQLDKGVGADLIAGYQRKQAEEIAKLQYEAFKDSPMYVQLFDDLGSASTTMLNAMRDRLVSLKDEWKNLDPTQLKEMQKRLREIDEQLTSRNPFKALVKSLKEYRRLRTKGDALGSKSSKEADEKLLAATKKRIEAEEEYLKLLKDEKATQEQIAEAKKKLDQAESGEKAAQKAKEVWQDVSITMGTATDTILGGLGAIGDIANGVADIMESLGADEEDVTYWRTIGSSISEITAGLQDVVQSVMKGDLMGVITGIITAIPKMFVGFVNIFNAGRIRRANKEIKRQQELLDQLQYTHSRLEKAAEKVFGADYLRNYNQQLRNLQAQQLAYEKQLQAEKSKGKKADKDKLKEYEEKIRDVKDEIADMQGKISEKMLGTDLTSAARDFAKAWIDAYKEVGRAGAETSAKMKEKFQDMIENMVVEGALAAVMQKALQPMFDMIDNMSGQDFYNESFWKKVAATAEQGAEDADKGAQTLMKFLEQAGISVKDISTEYTGIKREVAGATSEEMNANTAALNAQNYYLSQVPGIAVNVALIRQYMETGASGGVVTTATGWTDWQQQAMDSYLAIQRNTAETVVECRRAAQAAENAVAALNRVITVKGSKHGVQVYM